MYVLPAAVYPAFSNCDALGSGQYIRLRAALPILLRRTYRSLGVKWEPLKLSLNSAISHFTDQSQVNLSRYWTI
jgi:hypothetical protein